MRLRPATALRRGDIAPGALALGLVPAGTALAQSPTPSRDPVRAGINGSHCGNPVFSAEVSSPHTL